MHVEPSPNPDGSCNCWHYHQLGVTVAILERVSRREWLVHGNDFLTRTFRTRREAVNFIVTHR